MKLEQLQIFHNLTEDEMQKSLVCSQAVVQKYQKNEYIFSIKWRCGSGEYQSEWENYKNQPGV